MNGNSADVLKDSIQSRLRCQNNLPALFTTYLTYPKLYIPITINTEKELLRTAILADNKWAGFWILADLLLK